MQKKTRRPLPIAVIVMIDLLLTAAIMLSFCYFHHVKNFWGTPTDIPTTGTGVIQDFTKPSRPLSTSQTPSTSIPTTSKDPITSGSSSQGTTTSPITTPPEPQYDFSGDFGYKFGSLFSADNSVTVTEDSYKSHDIYMTLTSFDGTYTQQYYKNGSYSDEHVVYYLMDVYVRNIENLYTAYSTASYVQLEDLVEIDEAGSKFVETIAAISGDLYLGFNESKPVIVRNGTILRQLSYIKSDICVLYWDGSMETISPGEYNWDKISAKGPYQIWSFGPELMDNNGNAKKNINSSIWKWNPRAAIGCVEPGHYVFCVVSGFRDKNQRDENGVGINLDELAKIMEDAGCKVAYNLDGGASTYGWYRGDRLVQVSNANGSVRHISDIICIGEIKGNKQN